MPGRQIVLAIGLLIFAAGPALSVAQQDYADCDQTSDLPRSMAACTRVIEDQSVSVTDRVLAYLKRGNIYAADGKQDEAIANYAAAIERDPKNVFAYISRAIAYFRKGDRGHAGEDYGQAHRLDTAKVDEMREASAELKEIGAVALANGALQPAAPAPAPIPAPAAPAPANPAPARPPREAQVKAAKPHCGWFAIAVCRGSFGEAQSYANQHRIGSVIDTSSPGYTNFRKGYFCVAKGPADRGTAMALAAHWHATGVSADAYAKNACR